VVVVEESGSFGFPFFIFVNFFRVGIIVLHLPALDFGTVLWLSGFANFLYIIFKGLFSKLLHSNFDIERTIMERDLAYVVPLII